VISTQAAARLGLAANPTDIVLRAPRDLTSTQRRALRSLALSDDRLITRAGHRDPLRAALDGGRCRARRPAGRVRRRRLAADRPAHWAAPTTWAD